MQLSMLAILRVWFETTFGRWITFRSLAAVTIVSTTLCLVSLAAVAVLAVKVSAHPDKPADVRTAAAMRPWLSPVSIAIERLPLRADGKPRINVTLNYVNVGREPARSVVVEMRSGTVPQDLSSATLNAVLAGDNTTCDSLITPEKGGIVFPSTTLVRSYSQTDIMASEELINAKQGVLVIQACMKYRASDGSIHLTKLCQYVEPEMDKPLDQRRMRACGDGNDAN